MNENDIKKAVNSVEPEPGAKERMYQNIMKKAELTASAGKAAEPKKKTAVYYRRILSAAACVCIAAFGVLWCIRGGVQQQPTENNVFGGNPFVEVENAEAFKSFSVTLDAPDGAQDISYAVIDGRMAEVRFTLNGKSYLARASAQDGDFSGLNGIESEAETVDAKTNAVLVNVEGTDGVICKISWTNGKISYCLFGTDGAGKDEVTAVYRALKK